MGAGRLPPSSGFSLVSPIDQRARAAPHYSTEERLGGEQRTEGMCPRCHPLSEAGSRPALLSRAWELSKALL